MRHEELIERLEDAEALKRADETLAAIRAGEETVPWEEVRDKIGAEYDPEGSRRPWWRRWFGG